MQTLIRKSCLLSPVPKNVISCSTNTNKLIEEVFRGNSKAWNFIIKHREWTGEYLGSNTIAIPEQITNTVSLIREMSVEMSFAL
jgi:hypothetical protein